MFREQRDYVVDRIEAIDELSCRRPEEAFYPFVDPDVEASSLAAAKELLTDYGIVLALGDGFGDADEGQLRLCFANDRDRLGPASTALNTSSTSVDSEVTPKYSACRSGIAALRT
ncbi:hypothetical protein G9464_10535 [Halostella sp. JP-L12]|uniref:hypothetical protein n=1 Tax=Halostella TaxID=1843185 RepID=UPI0013CEA46B|nr:MULTISPECIES: hypothetical protein [Halostella]NHN48032.1 hypothetical protein [Halostella sp. JP-L12]